MSLNQADTAHRTAGLVYCLWLLGILFGITAVVGVYINYSKLASVRGTHAYSHFIWQIVSFWTVFAGALLTIILWPSPVARIFGIASFGIWIFSGIVGSWFLARSKRLTIFGSGRTVRHPHHLRQEVHNAKGGS